ncbi:MAG: hypothetical protein CMM76_12165 [Rhodospirillaceae bacterium]|nr:hypothetical protein [Rhodospirillaceae bacterium]|tara:strand:- start:440 stop:1027 length:588 start_codon:yes stop_codon:yes gene_type:complete
MSGFEFTSFLICLVWAFFEARMVPYRRYKMSDDFDLSNSEQSELAKAASDLAAARKEFTAADAEVTRLVAMGSGLPRTKSGDFDERNSTGKRLNRLLPPARSKSYSCERNVNAADTAVKEITERPKTRALEWARWEAWRNASRLALIVSACIALLMLIIGWAPADNWFYLGLVWFALSYTMSKILRKNLMQGLGI